MQSESNFREILNRWNKERFPHKEIRVIAKNYKDQDYVSQLIHEKAKTDINTFLDFGGVFFWEYWKHNKPKAEIIKFLLFSVSKKELEPVTQYSIILALTSSYKNHNSYKKAIYNKLNLIMNGNQENLSEVIIAQIYEAIY